MAIKIGNNTTVFKVGSGDCTIYLGNTLLYSPTPPTPSYKWLATYTGGTVSSAECDATSAITSNEIILEDLVDVQIGDCVTTIDGYAFSYCYSLSSITIGNSVTEIGDNAFDGCTSLTSITIPNSVTSIGYQAFQDCSSLTSVTIPDSVTSIGTQAFYGCYSLTSCTIGSGVTSIDYGAFSSCNNLSSVTITATTPPTLDSSVFDGTNDCPIYVPSQSVSAYQSASGWSDYAERIFAIQ